MAASDTGSPAGNDARRPGLLRRWRPGLVTALLLGAAVLWQVAPVSRHTNEQPDRAAAGPEAGTVAPSAVTASASAAAGPDTGRPASAPGGIALPGGLSPQQLADIESQWCTHGSQQELQQMEALMAGMSPSGAREADRFHAVLNSWPSTHARIAVAERLRQRWQQALRSRGDDASLALSWLLMTGPRGRPDLPRLQGLQDLASRSTHPFVQAAAHHWRAACKAMSGCQAVPASRWAALEPDNLAAWAAAASEGPPDAAQLLHWQQARRWDDGSAFLMRTLVDLPWPAEPGLAQEETIKETLDWGGAWSVLPASLLSHCSTAQDRQDLRAACARAAELLWSAPTPSALSWLLASELAERTGLATDAPWPARMASLEAAQSRQGAQRSLLSPEATPGEPCAWQKGARKALRQWAAHGEWAHREGVEQP